MQILLVLRSPVVVPRGMGRHGGSGSSAHRSTACTSHGTWYAVPVQLSISLLISIDLRGRCEKKKKKKRKILAAPVMQTECGRAESLA